MIWQAPAALAALALLAGPLAVHLLARRRAARVVFPGMRFVPAGRPAAVSLQRPSDLALLLLRLATVAAVVLACAQPVFLTAARQRAWSSRMARAVVVDTSPSVPADVAARLAEQQAIGAYVSRRFASSDLRDGLRRAAEWLETAPAAQREVAIVSDFQRGSIDAADLAAVPASVGTNPIRAGRPSPAAASGSIDGWRGGRWDAAVVLDDTSTRVTWTRGGAPAVDRLTVRAADADRVAAARAADAAQSFGVSAVRSRPVEISFAGVDAGTVSVPVTPWIATAAIALHRSSLLAATDARVHVGERGGVMIVDTSLTGRSRFAPAVVRAALLAAAPPLIDPEAETASIDDQALPRMVRPATPVALKMPPDDGSDGRWLWVLALALLFVEARVRRRMATPRVKEVHAHVA